MAINMNYTCKQTNKGWLISIRKGRKKTYTYFLWDDKHVMDKYLPYVFKHNQFRLGEPFGNNIVPIYLNYKAVKAVDDMTHPVNQIGDQVRMSAIWSYYRSFITEDTKKQEIKNLAEDLKTKLQLMGLDGLYQYVQTQYIVKL